MRLRATRLAMGMHLRSVKMNACRAPGASTRMFSPTSAWIPGQMKIREEVTRTSSMRRGYHMLRGAAPQNYFPRSLELSAGAEDDRSFVEAQRADSARIGPEHRVVLDELEVLRRRLHLEEDPLGAEGRDLPRPAGSPGGSGARGRFDGPLGPQIGTDLAHRSDPDLLLLEMVQDLDQGRPADRGVSRPLQPVDHEDRPGRFLLGLVNPPPVGLDRSLRRRGLAGEIKPVRIRVRRDQGAFASPGEQMDFLDPGPEFRRDHRIWVRKRDDGPAEGLLEAARRPENLRVLLSRLELR